MSNQYTRARAMPPGQGEDDTKRALLSPFGNQGAVVIHLRRLLMRRMLLITDGTPAVVLEFFEMRERLKGDDFRNTIESIIPFKAIRRHQEGENKGEPVMIKGEVQHVPATRTVDIPDETSVFGGLVRRCAKRIGLADKALFAYSVKELEDICYDVAVSIDALEPEKGKPATDKQKRAMNQRARFDFFPDGWEGSCRVAKKAGGA